MQKIKTTKHLALHRQTLRVLSSGEFTLAVGGGGTTTSGTITQHGIGVAQTEAKVSSSACHE